MGTLTELSLFTGYGGFTLGLRLAGIPFQTICYVENDSYCQRLIVERIKGGWLDDAPLWDDVRTFDGRPWRGHVDLLTAGFPCQPWSGAGQHKGEADEHNLWPDTLRVIQEVGPTWALLENSSKLLHSPYWGTILGNLADCGMDAWWRVISACQVGAPHTRERVFLLAHANGCDEHSWLGAQSNGARPVSTRGHRPVSRDWMDAIAHYAGSGYGVAHRVDRLRALGNGLVPAVVAEFLRGI